MNTGSIRYNTQSSSLKNSLLRHLYPQNNFTQMTCIKTFTAILASLLIFPAFGQNPLNFGSDIRTADPSAHVWKDGRPYIYASHDEECQEDFWMKDWRAIRKNSGRGIKLPTIT